MKSWQQQLAEHFQAAARVSAENDVDVDAFMRAAWNAFVEARPGMREYIEEMQLRGELEALRQAGRMAKA